MRAYDLIDPIYQAPIRILVGGNEYDVRKYIESMHGYHTKIFNKGVETDNEFGDLANDGLEFNVGGPEECFYVWIARKEIGLLHHEIGHLVFDVLATRGITYCDESEEAFTYWGAQIFEQAHRKLWPR